MRIEATGIPSHTRSLSITLSEAADGGLAFRGYILDLRKRGVVPVAGDLQGPGIIHHMILTGEVDRSTRTIRRIHADMPTVAFEASDTSLGESCRDLSGRVDLMAGTSIDQPWASQLGATIGGPLGCSHILTLAHLLGPTAAWALDRDGEHTWRAGERVFRRDISIDGAEADGVLSLAAQMCDLDLRPVDDLPAGSDRLREQGDWRIGATVQMGTLAIEDLTVWERRRHRDSYDGADWRERSATVAPVVGSPIMGGLSRRLLDLFGPVPGEDRPLLDALLMLAPATLQCMASSIDSFSNMGSVGQTMMETGGRADSCYVWRSEGALARTRSD